MTRPDLLALAERVERAEGPSRELDGEIMFDLFARPVGKNGYIWLENDPTWSFAIRFPGRDQAWFDRVRVRNEETIIIWRDGDPILMNAYRVPKVTKSVDDALTLLPEGYGIEISRYWLADREDPCCSAHVRWGARGGHASVMDAATPALALLAAILRALAAESEDR